MYFILYFRSFKPVVVASFVSPVLAFEFIENHTDSKYRVFCYQSGHVSPVSLEELHDFVSAYKVFNLDKDISV